MEVKIHDPWVIETEVNYEYNLSDVLVGEVKDFSKYSAIILAVAHDSFLTLEFEKNDHLVVYDVKGILPKYRIDGRL